MGLERAADDIVCSGLAQGFSKRINRACGQRFAGSGGEYSRTRATISSGRRSSDGPSFASRILSRNRRNVSRRRRTRSGLAKLSPIAIRRTAGKPARDAGTIDDFLRFTGNHAKSRCRSCEYSASSRQVDILVGPAFYFTCIASSHRIAARNSSVNEVTPNFSFARAQ